MTRSARAGDFEPEHVRTLGLLLPHLGRAMRVHLRLEDARVRADGAAKVLDRLAFGVVLVDRQARVILANRAAEALLAKSDGITADASGRTPRRRARLQACAAGRGGAMRLDRPSLGRPLSVLVAPVGTAAAGGWLPEPRPAAIVFVSDPEQRHRPPASHLREIYGLTAAEAGVAGAIATGQGVKDAARRSASRPARCGGTCNACSRRPALHGKPTWCASSSGSERWWATIE